MHGLSGFCEFGFAVIGRGQSWPYYPPNPAERAVSAKPVDRPFPKMTINHSKWSGRRRALVSVVLILAIMTGSLVVFGVMQSAKPKVQAREVEPIVYNVDVFDVVALKFTEYLTAFGTARADREVVLAAQVAGEITEVHPGLKVGRKVSAGQVETSTTAASKQIDPEILLRIDPRDYQQKVEQVRAAISSAQTEVSQLEQQKANAERQLELASADLASLKEEYDRVRKIRALNAGSASELTRALLEVRRYEDTIVQLENQISLIPHQIETARQRISSSQSDLSRSENDLQRTTVVPPFTGWIAEVMIEQGQFVRTGEPLVRLVDPSRIEVPVSMGLEDYLLVQQSILRGDFPTAALSENESASPRWHGRVVRVSPFADTASRTIEVFIEVINSEQSEPLLPGTFVFARIDGPQYVDRILIPREAMIDGTVYVVDADNLARARTLQTDRRLKSLIVVKEGLNPGDQVILTNLDIVRDATRVAPRAHATIATEIDRMKQPSVRIDDGAAPVPQARTE